MRNENSDNPEFGRAWEELGNLIDSRGFDVSGWLKGKSGEYSEETIEELRMRVKIRLMMRLGDEYDKWVEAEERKEKLRGNRKNLRFTFVAVAAAILVLVAVVVKGPQARAGLTEIGSFIERSKSIVDSVNGLEMQNRGRENTEVLREIVRLGQLWFANVDDDPEVEIIIAQHSVVLCTDYDGNELWHYNFSPADFEDDFIENNLRRTMEFLKNNAPKMDPDGHMGYAEFDGEVEGWFDRALGTLSYGMQLIDIMDYDGDAHPEILLNFRGAMFVMSHDGHRQDVTVGGIQRKHVILLDGTIFCNVSEIAEISEVNEGPELIIYKSTNWPYMTWDGLPLHEEDQPYIFGTRPGQEGIQAHPNHDRGLYIAAMDGTELCHINLPYHVSRLSTCDYDGDGQIEIILDTYTPGNDYVIQYGPESRQIAGSNFDWDTFLDQNGDPITVLQDTCGTSAEEAVPMSSTMLIFSMEDGIGRFENRIKMVETESRHTYFNSRCIEWNAGAEVISIQYTDAPDVGQDYWYSVWDYDREAKVPVRKYRFDGGYPEMRYYEGVFGLDLPGYHAITFGISPLGRIVAADSQFAEIDRYPLEMDEDEQLEESRSDVMVFDVEDIDGDGYQEILAGFGNLHAPWETRGMDLSSQVRILTTAPSYEHPDRILNPYHPEYGWDRYEVEGRITRAEFQQIDSDKIMDILIVSDFIYLLRLEK